MESASSPRPLWRRRGTVAAAALTAAALGTVGSFVLAPSGSTSMSIAPPAGVDATGAVASVSSMSSSVTRMIGGATKETGKTIGKVLVARGFTNATRISIAWLNPLDAGKVLNNPHAQLEITLYYPTSTTSGTCRNSAALAIADGGTTFCALRDTGATGSYSVTDGELFMAQAIQSGFLRPSIDGSATLAACDSDATPVSAPTAWCQPALSFAAADQRLLYIVCSITVPGGIPKGQQIEVGGLKFFLKARRAA